MIRVALLVAFVLCTASLAFGQPPKRQIATSPLCTRTNAIDNTKQQILFTRTFDKRVPRIAVLLRAADMLWPHDQERSLAAFMEAFDLAIQDFKEQGDQIKRTSDSKFAAAVAVPDQRFEVIHALARRDPAKARKLSDQILDEAAREAANKPPVAYDEAKVKTAEKLLMIAHGLAPTDPVSAVNFGRQSFRYPATMYLTMFIYNLAKTNQAAADRFYEEALAAYAAAPMDQFLYLSAYAFGNPRDAGDMPGHTFYGVPDGYVPNAGLQRLFTQRLLARAHAPTETVVEGPRNRLPDQAQMWLALTRLEKQIQTNLPDLAEAATQAKDKLYALLSPATQSRMTTATTGEEQPKRTFNELVEAAEKVANVDNRNQDLAMAVLGPGKGEAIERVVSVIEKISDSNLRADLLNWFYFFRTQDLIKNKQLDEARQTASKVVELDQRAYLFSRIAEESLKESEDQTQAREMLNEIADAAARSPKTIVSARTLLALAYLYARIDVNRGIEELGNAVKTINAIESPDFSRQFVIMKIEGKTFGSYTAFATPGFSPENTFREVGKLDFDSSLMQATTFNDKSLRALTTMAVIEPCLEVTGKPAAKKAKQ